MLSRAAQYASGAIRESHLWTVAGNAMSRAAQYALGAIRESHEIFQQLRPIPVKEFENLKKERIS